MICEVSALKQNAFIIVPVQKTLASVTVRESQDPGEEGLGQMTHP